MMATDFRSQRLAESGIKPIPFAVPVNGTGIDGCGGNSQSSNCTACDRLRLSGLQLHPKTTRNVYGGWTCINQVVDGVHVASVSPVQGVDQHQRLGGGSVNSHTFAGVSE